MYLIQCIANDKYYEVSNSDIINKDEQDININDIVPFLRNGDRFDGRVVSQSDDSNEIDIKLKEVMENQTNNNRNENKRPIKSPNKFSPDGIKNIKTKKLRNTELTKDKSTSSQSAKIPTEKNESQVTKNSSKPSTTGRKKNDPTASTSSINNSSKTKEKTSVLKIPPEIVKNPYKNTSNKKKLINVPPSVNYTKCMITSISDDSDGSPFITKIIPNTRDQDIKRLKALNVIIDSATENMLHHSEDSTTLYHSEDYINRIRVPEDNIHEFQSGTSSKADNMSSENVADDHIDEYEDDKSDGRGHTDDKIADDMVENGNNTNDVDKNAEGGIDRQCDYESNEDNVRDKNPDENIGNFDENRQVLHSNEKNDHNENEESSDDDDDNDNDSDADPYEDFEHQVYQKNDRGVKHLINDTYIQRNVLVSITFNARSPSVLIRHIMDGVFKKDEIKSCTLKGSNKQEILHPKAVASIIAYMKKFSKSKGWKIPTRKEIDRTITCKLNEMKRD